LILRLTPSEQIKGGYMKKEITKIEEKKILKKMSLKAFKKRSLTEQVEEDRGEGHNGRELRDEGGYDSFVDDFTQWFDDLKATVNKPIEFEGEEPVEMNFDLNDYYFKMEEDGRPVPTLAIDGELYDMLVYGWAYGSNEWYSIMEKNGMGKRWDELIKRYSGEVHAAGLWYFYDVGYES